MERSLEGNKCGFIMKRKGELVTGGEYSQNAVPKYCRNSFIDQLVQDFECLDLPSPLCFFHSPWEKNSKSFIRKGKLSGGKG